MAQCMILDDDAEYTRLLTRTLEARIPQLRGNISLLASEKEFQEAISKADFEEPNMFILDMMIHWTDPSEPEAPSREALDGGYYRSGVRCLARLRERYPLKPVIVQSALDPDEIRSVLQGQNVLDEKVTVLAKRSGEIEKVITFIKDSLGY